MNKFIILKTKKELLFTNLQKKEKKMILLIKIFIMLLIFAGVGLYMFIAAEMIAKEMIKEEVFCSDQGDEVESIKTKI